MPIKSLVKDMDTGNVVNIEFEPKHTLDDVIKTAVDFFKKDAGAYVLRRNDEVLRGSATLESIDAKREEYFELVPDPEGG